MESYERYSLSELEQEISFSQDVIPIQNFTSSELGNIAQQSSKNSVITEIILQSAQVIDEDIQSLIRVVIHKEEQTELQNCEFDVRLFAFDGAKIHSKLFQEPDEKESSQRAEVAAGHNLAEKGKSAEASLFPEGVIRSFPSELLSLIASFLSFRELVHVWRRVNKKFSAIAESEQVWREALLSSFSLKHEQVHTLYETGSWKSNFKRLYSIMYNKATITSLTNHRELVSEAQTVMSFQFRVDSEALEKNKEGCRSRLQNLAADIFPSVLHVQVEINDEEKCPRCNVTLFFENTIDCDKEIEQQPSEEQNFVVLLLSKASMLSPVLKANGVIQDKHVALARNVVMSLNSSWALQPLEIEYRDPSQWLYKGDFNEMVAAFPFLDHVCLYTSQSCISIWLSNPNSLVSSVGYKPWEILLRMTGVPRQQ